MAAFVTTVFRCPVKYPQTSSPYAILGGHVRAYFLIIRRPYLCGSLGHASSRAGEVSLSLEVGVVHDRGGGRKDGISTPACSRSHLSSRLHIHKLPINSTARSILSLSYTTYHLPNTTPATFIMKFTIATIATLAVAAAALPTDTKVYEPAGEFLSHDID